MRSSCLRFFFAFRIVLYSFLWYYVGGFLNHSYIIARNFLHVNSFCKIFLEYFLEA